MESSLLWNRLHPRGRADEFVQISEKLGDSGDQAGGVVQSDEPLLEVVDEVSSSSAQTPELTNRIGRLVELEAGV